MKRIFKNTIISIIGIPICFVLFVVIGICGTLLWPIVTFVKFIEFIICIFNYTYKIQWLDDLVEFIFVVYGFALLCLILPISLME